jgi:exopolysaccharide biosynthesis polyprenyl glycosylphosphotransferase
MRAISSTLKPGYPSEADGPPDPLITRAWMVIYLRCAASADCSCAFVAGLLALQIRFGMQRELPIDYLGFTVALPALWWLSVSVSGGYDSRFIGLGSDEFRRVLNAAAGLIGGVALISYAGRLNLDRGYLVISLPSAAVLDLVARFCLRKRLHKLRQRGACTQRVVAVGHPDAVANLVRTLRRDSYHGLSVVAVCLAGTAGADELADIPVAGELDSVTTAVGQFAADTVAVLACPEMDGTRLRELAWELEKAGTDLCVAPALLDVAGPRTTIRPVAGLPLLHVDHPALAGCKQIAKTAADRAVAALALMLLAPLFATIALAIKFGDRGPVFFCQTRVGKAGRAFTLYKFRTMVVDAERRKAEFAARNESSGVLFKMRLDPRVTRVGTWLRRWSLDELPQLVNVLLGDMSLVGPRPALPDEAAHYGAHMRRRLVVKPGITGLWQVSGRSDLPWEEAVRLDLRYVENWSFALDLQVLWKTWSAVIRGSGAYLASIRRLNMSHRFLAAVRGSRTWGCWRAWVSCR